MKIVYSMPALLLCGGAVHHCSVIRRLAARGHKVAVYAPLVRDLHLLPKLPESVEVHPHKRVRSNLYTLPSELRPIQFFQTFWDLTVGLRQIAHELPTDADIIHATFYPNVYAGAVAQRRLGNRCALVASVHDDPRLFLPISYRRRYSWLWANLPRAADHILTVSEFLARVVGQLYQRAVTVVGNGVDEELLRIPRGDPKQATHILAGAGRPYVLFVGAVSYHKGIDVLIEAFAEVRRHHPDLLLALVGKCHWPPFLQSLARRYQLVEHLRHIPGVDRESLRHLLDHASCFVYPSRTEGFGLPPLEAMARGVPVVCTPCEGMSEYARAGHNCLQVPQNSPTELAQAVCRVLENRELATQLAQQGRITASLFTWDRVAERTEKAMQTCLEVVRNKP